MTETENLLARSYGNVTDAEAIAAGGEVYERSANYTKYRLPDGSQIAVPHVPFDE
jgi:hypothetical protein